MRPVPIVTYLDAQRRLEDRRIAAFESNKFDLADFPDLERRLEDARQLAYMEGYEAGKAEALVSIAEKTRESESQSWHMRSAKVEQELAVVRSALKKEMVRFRSEVENSLAIIMRSLLESSLFERNRRELKQAIRTLVNISGAAEVTITCSKDLIETLQQTFASSRFKIEFIESDEGISLKIEADQALIKSKYEKWCKEIDDLFHIGIQVDQ